MVHSASIHNQQTVCGVVSKDDGKSLKLSDDDLLFASQSRVAVLEVHQYMWLLCLHNI